MTAWRKTRSEPLMVCLKPQKRNLSQEADFFFFYTEHCCRYCSSSVLIYVLFPVPVLQLHLPTHYLLALLLSQTYSELGLWWRVLSRTHLLMVSVWWSCLKVVSIGFFGLDRFPCWFGTSMLLIVGGLWCYCSQVHFFLAIKCSISHNCWTCSAVPCSFYVAVSQAFPGTKYFMWPFSAL